jgi:hypothetical protein
MRSRSERTWAAAILLSLTTGAAAETRTVCAPPQALRELPDGWVHVPTHWVDQWHGTYHDAESGAYVSYAAYGPGKRPEMARPQPGDTVEEGVLGGFRYSALYGPDARSRYERAYEGPPPPEETAHLADPMLPGADAWLLGVVFVLPYGEFSFEAPTYDAKQAERVRALLLSK